MKGNLKTIIILAVVVIIGGYIFYTTINSQSNNSNSNEANVINTSNDDQYDNLYASVLYNYQVEFPVGWEMQDSLDDYVSWIGPVAQEQIDDSEVKQAMKIEIWVTDMTGVSLQDAVDADMAIYSPDEILDRTDMTVDGQDAIQVKINVLGYTINTYILKDEVLYKFVGYVGDYSENTNYVVEYSSILNTLEFTK